MEADYGELIFEVKNISKTIRDIVRVRKEIEKTGKETKNLQDALLSGWSFGKVFQAMQKFGDAFRDVQITMRSFSSIYGSFNKRADDGVKMLINDFQVTEEKAKKLLNVLGTRTMNLGLDPDDFTKINVELARITHEISAATGQRLDEVGKKLSQSLAGEVGGLKDLGIIINSSSDKFKDAVSKLQQTGITEEAAKAIVIFGEIQKQTKEFDGSFKEGSKSIVQSFNSIQDKLQNGAFARAGEVLSATLVPLLNVVDSLLSNKVVQGIAGITLAVSSLTVAVLLLKKAVVGFSSFIGLGAGMKVMGGFIKTIGVQLASLIPGLLPVLSAAFAALATAVTVALPYILAVAIGAAIGYAIGKTIAIIKRDGFVNVVKAVGEWFRSLGERIANWFKSGEWESNEDLKNKKNAKINKSIQERFEALKKAINDKNTLIKDEVDALFKIIDENNVFGLNDFTTETPAKEYKEQILKLQDHLIEVNMGATRLQKVLKEKLNYDNLTKNFFQLLQPEDQAKFYDIFNMMATEFSEELQKLGVTALEHFKQKRVEDGDVKVTADEIADKFNNNVLVRDFEKIRQYILDAYASGKTSKFVDALSKTKVYESFKFVKDLLPLLTPEELDKVLKSIDPESLKALKRDLQRVFDENKALIKEGYFDLSKIADEDLIDVITSDNFKNVYSTLITKLQQNLIKSIEDQKHAAEEIMKLKPLYKQAIERERNLLKDWRESAFDALANKLDVEAQLVDPSLNNLTDRFVTQIEKIKGFKDIFKIDDILNNVQVPDFKNAEIRIKKLRDDLANDLSILSQITNIPLEDLTKKSGDEIKKLIESITKKTYEGFKAEEELFKKSLSPYDTKEKIELLKELQQHYLDKFNIEMEGLEKEREYIQQTNDFIKESLSKAMEWKPQGISAIQSNTMDAYKFMTSGYGSIGSISTAINQKNNEANILQKETNKLITSTKSVIDQIEKRISELVGNAPTLTFVN